MTWWIHLYSVSFDGLTTDGSPTSRLCAKTVKSGIFKLHVMTWRLIRCLPVYYITSLGCFSEIHPFHYCQIFIKSSTSMHQLTPYPRQHFRTQNGGFLFVNSVLLVLSHYYFLMVSLLRNTLPIICKHSQNKYRDRADSRFAPIKWETALLCNDVSHWLGANLESVLRDHGKCSQ